MSAPRKWLLIPPVIFGVMLVALALWSRQPPERVPPQEQARALRVITVQLQDVVPRTIGYGTAEPAHIWRAVSEIQGRVLDVHTELRPGAFLAPDVVVLRVDPREYELVVSRLEAEIAEIEARLSELEVQSTNDRASLAIEQASLELAEADLEHVRNLAADQRAPNTEVRSEQRVVLAQQQRVQNLQNALNLVPRRRATLQASLAVSQARHRQAQIDLEKTVFRTPFACRIGEVSIEKGQYLQAGELLFEADGGDATEINVQVPLDHARHLVLAQDGRRIMQFPDGDLVRDVFNVTATARMRIGDATIEWPARFVRLREQFDPITRAVGVVVAVDKPYELAVPGQRPPLVRGAFCEVELRGVKLTDRVIVPRSALHGDHVYTVDDQDRLRRRPVDVLFVQSDFACIASGLDAGTRVVVSDPTPAIDGALVAPVADAELQQFMAAQAMADTDVR